MGIRTPLFQPQMPPVHPKCRLPSHDNGQVFKQQKIGAFSTLCGRRKREGERGREKSTKAGKRKGSACYKSWCFCIAPTINFSKLLRQHQLSMHDQSQLGGFSPRFDLNITLFTEYCQVETLFSSDIIIERNKTFFTVLAPTANMTNRLQAVSLFFTARSVQQTVINFVWIHMTFGLTSSSTMVTKNRTVASMRRQ